jgi:chromate transporter
MKKLFKMFISFFKIGVVTFGGGYAMIPFIEDTVVNKNKWVSKEDFMDMLIVSQSLPGAMVINCCTFIGYRLGGVLGGIIGILGVALPSFIIILIIAISFVEFRENYWVNLAFKGIAAAVPMLVLMGVISMGKGVNKNFANISVGIIALIALVVFNIHPVIVTICGAIYGVIFLRKKVK